MTFRPNILRTAPTLIAVLTLILAPVSLAEGIPATETCSSMPPALAAAFMAPPEDGLAVSPPEVVPMTDHSIVIGGQSCTFGTSCDTSIVCLLPDGTEGNVSVTTRTCCPVCETLPCRLEPCTFDIVAVSCGCS